MQQESRAVARKPRDAAAVLFGLKFANNIHYKFKSSQALKAYSEFQAKQNLTQNGHSRLFKVTPTVLQRYGQTDRRTTYDSNTALCTTWIAR